MQNRVVTERTVATVATVPTVPNGGDLVAEVLSRQGVKTLFTLCGGHISPILVGAKARGIRVVDARGEAAAVFAADATARLTGIPGVAAVTAGPGVTNSVTALVNARMAGSPLVLLGGATATALKGRGSLQDVDQSALVGGAVKAVLRATRVKEVVPLVEKAFRLAQEGVPGPVFVELPVDLLYGEAVVRSWYGAATPRGGGLSGAAIRWYLERHVDRLFADAGEEGFSGRVEAPPPEPGAGSAGTAALLLSRSRRPVLVAGSQALLGAGTASATSSAINALRLPVYLSGTARGLLGRDSPLQLRHRRKEALREADLVLLAGVPCDFRLDYGRQIGREATVVAVNRDAAEVTRNRRPALAVEGDPGLFLRQLSETEPAGFPREGWLALLKERDAAREAEIGEEARAAGQDGGDGVDPLLLCLEMERTLPDSALLVGDGGDFVATAAYVLRPRAPLSWLDPGVFGTLGVGAGFALAAKCARPADDVVLLWGDGASGYGLVELDTFARHGLGVIAVVGNDACWSQIAREQVEVLGDDVGTVLCPNDYHVLAEGLGAKGILVRSAEEVRPALERAVRLSRAGNAVLVNVLLRRSGFRKGSISI